MTLSLVCATAVSASATETEASTVEESKSVLVDSGRVDLPEGSADDSHEISVSDFPIKPSDNVVFASGLSVSVLDGARANSSSATTDEGMVVYPDSAKATDTVNRPGMSGGFDVPRLHETRGTSTSRGGSKCMTLTKEVRRSALRPHTNPQISHQPHQERDPSVDPGLLAS